MDASGSPSAQKGFDDVGAMHGCTVPNDQQLAGNFAQKQVQEAHDIRPFVRVILDLHEQPSIRGQCTDDQEMVTSQRHGEDRRLAHWRIGAHRHGQQVKRRRIYKDDGARFLFRLFFNSATRWSHQVWMDCASR